AAIAGSTYQATETLPEQEDRLRHGEFVERIGIGFGTGRNDRLVRHGKRQLGDDDSAQAVAGDVDAFPEHACAEQHGFIGAEKLIRQNLTTAAVTLRERLYSGHAEPCSDIFSGLASLCMTGEQRHNTTAE